MRTNGKPYSLKLARQVQEDVIILTRVSKGLNSTGHLIANFPFKKFLNNFIYILRKSGFHNEVYG